MKKIPRGYEETTEEVRVIFLDDKQEEDFPQFKVEKKDSNFSIRYTLDGEPKPQKVGKRLELKYKDKTFRIEHNDRSNKAGQDRCNTSASHI
jgi:hypothetical protein